MAVVIRMKRAGAKKRPFYRVVVANSRSPRDGRYIEQLGYYDPLTNPATFQIDAVKMALWIQRGALPSESVGVMVAKHAPEALRRPARAVPAIQEAAGVAPADLQPEPKKAKTKAKGAAAKGAPRAKAKAVKKAKASTKGSEKKAHTRAKNKARKASGVAKPRATKKAKKKKS
ncbi:MAG TPA: 30S ribosomal protein S16 [Candidatus Eisenbacteria bacterium]|nr:30S ribosomal protein S16 [Candidatus Eisenbacteria bacterium]